MRRAIRCRFVFPAVLLVLVACSEPPVENRIPLEVPRGFVPLVELINNDRLIFFGPFKGYYFRRLEEGNDSRLQFVCFNEDGMYTMDQPVNALLYRGEAVLTDLTEHAVAMPEGGGRIRPVFFDSVPAVWLESRPEPRDEFLHFHSCYNARGATYSGYWFRHEALAEFTYDMGGRLGPESVLYHQVTPGVDTKFARVVEFDQGPGEPGPR